MMFTRAFTSISTRSSSRVLPPTSTATQRRHYYQQFRLHVPLPLATIESAISTNSTDNDMPAPARKIRKTQLRTDLKEYRIQQSAPLKKPAYSIFTNAALDEIYVRLPKTLEELSEVKGIGPKKLQQYGNDILSIVAPYTNAFGKGQVASDSSVQQQPVPIPTLIDPNSLTTEQRKASELLLSSERPNGFVTGSAGTGKSYLLKYLVQQLHQRQRVGVCAPTGVAAIHVGGNTLHAFFGIGLGTGSISNLVKKVTKNAEAVRRIDETDVLIIDECSMLSSDLLELLDSVARQVRKGGSMSDVPFGGMQVICFGDFFQLPPIFRGPEKPFCFDSFVWEELGLTNNMVQLREVMRQGDNDFVSLLNKVRIGKISHNDIEELNARCLISEEHPLPTDGIVPTRLYSLNKDVDGENESRLSELEGEEVVCRANNIWRESMPTETLASVKKQMADSLNKEVPAEVRLKVGAQVMLTRNKNLERNLVNGSRGVVVRFDKAKDSENMIPVVRFDCGVVTSIAPVEAARYNPEGGPGCLVRMQVPLKLAWALTVHKSQGTTLSRAMLDISSAFEYGQCYVALSRLQSLEGLWLLKPARLRNVKVSPQVLSFYKLRDAFDQYDTGMTPSPPPTATPNDTYTNQSSASKKTSSRPHFYAVARGRKPGIYQSWEACLEQVDGFPGPIHRKFSTVEEAEWFVWKHRDQSATP